VSKLTSIRVLLSCTLALYGKRVFVAFTAPKRLAVTRLAILVLLLTPVVTTVYSITRAGTSANNTAYAVSPTTLNFQARLLSSSGNLVPDGIYNVEFKLYNASTSSGSSQGSCTGDANCLWTETRLTGDPSNQQIVVKNGYLSAYLGDKTALPSNIWNQQLWLTMNIGGTSGPTWDGEMTPRIRLTSVPFAFRATVADSAETLQKNTGSFTGTVDFATMTADRKFLFPDTSLATTASPGTICVYNGAASNCPAASGSAYYIQNDTVLQTATNFNIQGRDSGVNGTIVGVLRGAAAGQTVDLLQFQASGGSVLGAVTAAGNLKVASSVDVYSAGTLSVGTTTATAITVGKTGITTTIAGALTVNEAATFNDNVTVAASKSLTLTGGNTASRPASPTEGMLYFDTTTKQLLVYANGKWQGDRSTATKIVAASNSSQAVKDAADYVADGTGDQAEINSALTAAAGGKVYLTEGTYTVSASISIPNNTTLAGAGRGTLITIPNSHNAGLYAIVNSDTATGTGVTVQDLHLDGNESNQTSGEQFAIKVEGIGDGATGRSGAKLINLWVENWDDAGIIIEGDNSIVMGVHANNSREGIYAFGSYNTITGNIASGNSSEGIVLDGSGSGNTVVGNTVMDSGLYGIADYGLDNTVISSNTISNTTERGIYAQGNQASITGNTVSNSGIYGIEVLGVNDAVTGNIISDSGGSTDNNGLYVSFADSALVSGNKITDSSATTTNYAISIHTFATNTTLTGNTLGGGSINDTGTGTIYGGQLNSSGNYLIQPAGTIELIANTNITGNLVASGDGTFNGGDLTVATTTGTNDSLKLSVTTGGAAGFLGTITNADLTAARTWTLPNESGTFCMQGSANCGFAATTGGTGYIQNQNAGAQATSNFWISGTGRADTSITTPLLDTATAAVLNIGTNNATQINLNKNVVVAASQTLRITGDNTAGRPVSPAEGTMYFDTDTKQLLVYANGKWQGDRSTATKIVAASNSSQAVKDAADYVASGTADQNTINAALTAAAGGKVYLTEGTYTINGSISVPNNTTLAGAGAGTVVTIPNNLNTSTNAIVISDTATGANVTIQDFRLEGNSANQTSGYYPGIYIEGTGTSKLTGIKITGMFINDWQDGIFMYADADSIISNNYFKDNYYNGIYISAYNTSSPDTSYVVITNNIIESGADTGIQVEGVLQATISNNNISNLPDGILLYSSNTTVTGNTMTNVSIAGIYIRSANNTITGNIVTESGGSTDNNGITLASSGNSNLISGNKITDTAHTVTNYAINIAHANADDNYLSNNILGGGSINDISGGTTIYAGQVNGSGNYLIQPAGTIELIANTNITGNLVTSGDGTFNGGDLTVATTTGTNDSIKLSVTTGGAAGFLGTITNADLTAARTWTLPNESGTFCMQGSTNCGFAATTGGTGYIQNQNASQQATSNFWISGSGQADTSLITPTLTSTGALSITSASNGNITVNANGTGLLDIQDSVTIAASQSLTLTGGNTASRPASPTEGMLYFDTTTKQLLIYANGKWQADRTEAVIVAASNSSQADKDAADYVADGNTGAAADGDQVQINSALTAGAGKKVILLAGTYTVDASINVPSNTVLTGVGAGTLITLPNSWSTSLTLIKNSNYGLVAGNNDITISHLKIDGNLSNVVSGTQSGIQLSANYSGTTNMRNVHIDNVVIQNFNGGGIYTEANSSRITNNVIDTVAYGIDVEAGSNSTVTGNVVRSTTEIGILVYSSGGNTITGNALSNITKTGIDVEGTGTANNTISGNTISGNSSVQSGIFAGDTANHNVFSNNTITGFVGSGIATQNVSYNTISGNTISESGGSTLNEAIYLESSDANTITGNIITDSSASSFNYAIDINNASCDNNYIADNTLGGGTINDASGGDTIYAGQATGTTFAIQPSSSITITGNAASTIQTTAGNLTADAAATLNLGTTNATSVSISRTGQTTTVNGALTVAQVTRLNGNVGINIGSATPTADLQFGESSSRTINVQGRTTNAAGNSLTIAAGAAGTGASAFTGGTLTLQGGAAAGTGNANGGNVVIAGGAGTGTGVMGLVGLSPTAFTAVGSTQSFGSSATLGVTYIDNYGTVPMSATTSGVTITIPAPTNATIGRIVYVANVGATYDFNILLAGTSINIALKPNTTATLIWNGNGWTAAGASSSTDLQAAYNNTLTSAGGAELVLNPTGGAADGLTIRNNGTTPIVGGLLEVQSSIGTNLFSVNNYATEYASDGGAETAATFTTNWLAAPGGGTVTRESTTSSFIATGQASAKVVTAGTNQGLRNKLTAALTSTKVYQVSFTAKLSTGSMTTLDVAYSDNGTTATSATCTTGQTVLSTAWSKVTCTFTAAGTITTNNAVVIRQSDATGRSLYIDNLSITEISSTTTPSNVQIGGGLLGGQPTLFTLDRFSSAPVSGLNSTYYGSMYYDTTTNRIQCYEADGWGACGSAPDNIITLTPEYTGAVLNGTGIGVMTADFCANQSGILQVNHLTLCTTTGEARNYYHWTSPQASAQTYSIYVNYKLPSTFKGFLDDNTIKLTALKDHATNAGATLDVYRKNVVAGTITQCGSNTTITTGTNAWNQTSLGGSGETGCGFVAGDYVIFKITVTSQSNGNVYIENLDFTFSNT
jgi:parallel beta-helix repeat protein